MKNIHILPTDKPSRLWVNNLLQGKLELSKEAMPYNTSQNIYITSDEEIKDGDWVKNISFEEPIFKVDAKGFTYVTLLLLPHLKFKKVVLTTDQDLIKDGVQAIDDEFLNWFVKNSSCEEVAIERWTNYKLKNNEEVIFFNYKIIIPKEEPKQEILEEAKQMMVTQEDILEQIALTEARGEKIVKYLNRYKGDSIYNEIALAIEFGYQLKLEEDEK